MQVPSLILNIDYGIMNDMRLIINTGKGGVGKTSISAATGRRAAQMGYRTLVMSTDSAHSLADSLDIKLGPDITNIGPNLDALEIDIVHEMRSKWNDIQDYIFDFLDSQGVSNITADELAILPGMELIAALFYILDFDKNDKYDVVVMDTAPTGETLRLLSFPDISSWYADKLFHIVKRLLTLARATVGKVMDIPLPSNKVLESINDIKNKMEAVREVLEDPKKTTVRLVVNPERMVITETKRAYSYLCLYNKTVECLMVNRVYPGDIGERYFADKLKEQEKYLEEIHQSFDPMKIMFAYQMPTEMLGPEKLDKLAEMLYGPEGDPTEIYATESPMMFETKDGMDILRLKMPFTEKKDIELLKPSDDNIVVHIGNQKRQINLPLTLAKEELIGAELKDQELLIKFKREE